MQPAGPKKANQILQLPVIRELHARRLLFPAILGLAVVVVLVFGALEHAQQVPALRAPQIELPLPSISVPSIRPSLEKSPLTYESDYWLQLVELVRNKFVQVGPKNRPGIMVAPGVALTAIAAADDIQLESPPVAGASEVLTVSEDPQAATPLHRVLGVDAELNVALIAVKQPAEVGDFAPAALADLHIGAKVAVVGLSPRGDIVMTPAFVRSVVLPEAGRDAALAISVEMPPNLESAAIVDLDGDLAGVILRSAGGSRILAVDALMRLVDRLAAGTACQAIEVSGLSGEARGLLGVRQGVLVERVHDSAFVPEPSIREGDILLSWDRTAVGTAEEFRELYSETRPGELVRYRVRRDRRTVSGATRMPGPDCRPVQPAAERYAALGLTLRWAGDAWLVVRVDPDKPAAQAGITDGARIIGVAGRRFSRADRTAFARFEERPQPMIVTVREGDRVRMTLVAPPEPEPEPALEPEREPEPEDDE